MLNRILADIDPLPDSRVLVGFDKADDAGVYLLDKKTALIQTVDFFTPIVDDPYIFGLIAAANSLSDIYAMGGKPLTALSILAISPSVVEESDIKAMLAGGTAKMNEAGVPVIGGHSIRDKEAKLGYCVSGTARPDRIYSNAGARGGDLLMLTKPLGTGIVATALKSQKAGREIEEDSVRWMTLLNRIDRDILYSHDVHALTDITGFGFVGHALEMAEGSEVYFRIRGSEVPLIEGALKLAEQGFLPGGLDANRDYFSCRVEWGTVGESLKNILLDPQTSGGLLVSLPERRAGSMEKLLLQQGFSARVIGSVAESGEKRLAFD